MSIEACLHPDDTWTKPFTDALVAVFDGLTQTGRKSDWGLAEWPYQRVTNLNPFVRRSSDFSVVAEIVNSSNRVIGRQTFQAGGWWDFGFRVGNTVIRPDIDVSADVVKTLSFTVKVDDITDDLTIRVASVNGASAETAALNGLLQVMAVSNIDKGYLRIPNCSVVRGYESKGITSVYIPNGATEIYGSAFIGNRLTSVTIPNSVTSIEGYAFYGNQLTSVTIPNSVTSIGSYAFYGNLLTSVTIPDSVTRIAYLAFEGNRLNSITIGANVDLRAGAAGPSAFNSGGDFGWTYERGGKKAGTYILTGRNWILQ